MTAFAGVRGTGDWGTDERPKSFQEGILFLNPNGTAPLFAMMSKMGKETLTDPEHSWWAEPNDITRLQINGALSNSTTAIVVDSGDPSASNLDARWGTALNLNIGDLLMVEPSSDSATFNHEIIRVTARASATAFTAARGQAGTAAAAIGNNAHLLKIGNAFEEGTRSPKAVNRNPIKYNNLCQIFKTTYELTGTAEQTRTRTAGDKPVQQDKRRKMFDHSLSIESALMFGQKHETTGTGGKPLRYMGGLREFIPSTILGANWSLSSLLDAVSPVFDWDTMAGDSRMVLCGNGALNNFNKKIVAQTGNAVEVNYEGKSKMYGMNFREYTVPQGTFMLKTHPLLSRHPLYTNSWWILDGSSIKWAPLRNRDTKFKDNIQANDEDTQKGQWMTEGTMIVTRGGLTCRYVGGFNK